MDVVKLETWEFSETTDFEKNLLCQCSDGVAAPFQASHRQCCGLFLCWIAHMECLPAHNGRAIGLQHPHRTVSVLR